MNIEIVTDEEKFLLALRGYSILGVQNNNSSRTTYKVWITLFNNRVISLITWDSEEEAWRLAWMNFQN